MLDATGRVISRHPWAVISAWLLIVVLAFGAAFGGWFGDRLFSRLANGSVTVDGPSREGQAVLGQTSRGGGTEVMVLDGIQLYDPRVRTQIEAAHADIRRISGVTYIRDPWSDGNDLVYDAGSFGFISADQRAILMVVGIQRGLPPAAAAATYEEVRERLEQVAPRIPGAVGHVGGAKDIVAAVTEQLESDLRTGEGVALPISLLIMVVVFGGFLAAGLPIIGAIAAIGGALATLLGFTYVFNLDPSTVNVVTVLGLGLCIDYGLLLVSRYREEMLRLPGDPSLPPTRRQREVALRRTMTSAGRTVMFSGVIVAISLSGLLVFSNTLLRGMGAAGVSVVLVALLVALTLVPALLAVVKVRMIRPGLVHRVPGLGRVARALGDTPSEDGFFARLARTVQQFPLIVVSIVLGVLFVLSLPVTALHVVSSSTALLPIDNPNRQLVDALQQRFPYAASPIIQVVTEHYVPQKVTDGQGGTVDIAESPGADPYYDALVHVAGVASIDPPSYRGERRADGSYPWTVLSLRVGASDSSPTAIRIVKEIRGLDPPFAAYTVGNTATLVDANADLVNRAPWAIGIVVLVTLVLLFLMTGSVLVPVKALAMNVVSLGAALGVVTWVFQFGELSDLLDFTSTGGLETFIPPMTLAFGFGLAMDYEVFLLSRIAEYRREGYSNDESVALGLQRSGRIISSAAVIIIVVFLGFVAGQLLMIKETGTALAVAVAIDATLVRMLLVPATMTLLGDWNWWAPPFLRRLHDRFGITD
ncbi:MMPL family transporter [Spongisporangium articulatum]|uniref:MMPL family transporter n=1 Tax=Spongisporangium articulatum TaxID=3362603 RepID=A0ABW8AR73_9ACTN